MFCTNAISTEMLDFNVRPFDEFGGPGELVDIICTCPCGFVTAWSSLVSQLSLRSYRPKKEIVGSRVTNSPLTRYAVAEISPHSDHFTQFLEPEHKSDSSSMAGFCHLRWSEIFIAVLFGDSFQGV